MNIILQRSIFVGQNHQSSEECSYRAGWTSALEVRWAIRKTYSNLTYFNNRYTRRILHLGINKLYCDLIDQSSRLLLSSTYYSKYLNSHTLWRASQHTCTRPLDKKNLYGGPKKWIPGPPSPSVHQTQADWSPMCRLWQLIAVVLSSACMYTRHLTRSTPRVPASYNTQ